MFNKNDPLIASVKKVMEQNEKERQAVAVVNEKFGIQDRKALPHQQQSAWDAEYKKVLSENFDLDEQSQAEAIAKLKNRPVTSSSTSSGPTPPKPTPKPEVQGPNRPEAPKPQTQADAIKLAQKRNIETAAKKMDLSNATPDIKVGAARTTPKSNVPFNSEKPAKIDQDLTKKKSVSNTSTSTHAMAAPKVGSKKSSGGVSRPVAKVKVSKGRSRLQSRTERDGLAMDMRENNINEISSDLARRYIKKAKASETKARGDLYKHSWLDMKDKRNGEGLPDASAKAAHHDLKVANKRESGISLAKGKLTGDQHTKWEKPKGKRNITQVTKDTKVLTVKEEDESPKQKKLQKILNRRFGKGDGKESVSQSRREDK